MIESVVIFVGGALCILEGILAVVMAVGFVWLKWKEPSPWLAGCHKPGSGVTLETDRALARPVEARRHTQP